MLAEAPFLGDVRNPQVYLFIAARNRVVDHTRRLSAQRSLPLQEGDEEQLQFSPDPEQLLITSEMMGKMEEAIRELPPNAGRYSFS